jgi:hypothetical protein
MKKSLKKIFFKSLCVMIMMPMFTACHQTQQKQEKNLVETGQSKFYDKDGIVIDQPAEGEQFYGQDAQYGGIEFSFTDNGDSTVTDNNTGLMWQKIPYEGMISFSKAAEYCENLVYGGYNDWRIPSTKELFSLTNFEPNKGEPYLDTNYFKFPPRSKHPIGGPRGGGPQSKFTSERSSMDRDTSEMKEHAHMPPPNQKEGSIGKDQGQFWTSDIYKVGTTHGGKETGFGVNHFSGHIKGYPTSEDNPDRGKHVRAVRGDKYLINNFVDNGDGTISDLTTGLMWMKDDYGESIMWEEALAYCENLKYTGYNDWKLPNVKELQSIVDYSGAYPAVDPKYFNSTKEENKNYYTWLWTSTSSNEGDGGDGKAWYVAFGKAVGLDGFDSHGAGAVRNRTKYEESAYTEEGDTYVCSLRAVRVIK